MAFKAGSRQVIHGGCWVQYNQQQSMPLPSGKDFHKEVMYKYEVKGNLLRKEELGFSSMSSIYLHNPLLQGPAAMPSECLCLLFIITVKLSGITSYSTLLSLNLLFVICSKPR